MNPAFGNLRIRCALPTLQTQKRVQVSRKTVRILASKKGLLSTNIFICISTEFSLKTQLNLSPLRVSVETIPEISQYTFIEETTYKFAENSSTAHPSWGASVRHHL
ncbi:hypothetical protein CSKR_108666 [Clonorchis sinensis]|uniref:Uncharacterized protein n=1 Tax=Clonorchis sinensis TaxID=79923 RepID=A0A3R7CBL1_CLOSI|nr:hypothetical protein CSKR_108666 [Clonorchis sinensis]